MGPAITLMTRIVHRRMLIRRQVGHGPSDASPVSQGDCELMELLANEKYSRGDVLLRNGVGWPWAFFTRGLRAGVLLPWCLVVVEMLPRPKRGLASCVIAWIHGVVALTF